MYTQNIKEQLSHFTPWQAAAFCVCTAERLLPNYACFSREADWGDPNQMRRLLNFCWNAIDQAMENGIALDLNIRLCDLITPDTEDFDLPSKSMALDAAIAVRITLECLEDNNNEHAYDASRCALDTVNMYLSSQAWDKGMDSINEQIFIESHPLMRQEIKTQNEIIELLNKYQNAQKDAYRVIHTRFFNEKISNLGFSWSKKAT